RRRARRGARRLTLACGWRARSLDRDGMFAWLRGWWGARGAAAPFPAACRRILQRNMRHFSYLDAEEQARLCQRIQRFVAEKYWEGCGGLQLDDEIRVTIAGQACLLVLGYEGVLY